LFGKWLGFGAGGVAVVLPWLMWLARVWRSSKSKIAGRRLNRRSGSSSRRSPRKSTRRSHR
jgi:ABC-type Na+ efflux pump permease subunit